MTDRIRIKRYENNEFSEREDLIIQEHRANIYVNGEHYISLMCLPQDLDELAVGFLFSEGVIGSYADVVKIDSGSAGDIFVSAAKTPERPKPGKRVLVSGFAGGSVNLPFLKRENMPRLGGSFTIRADEAVKMARDFNSRSKLFEKTGAVHSCALIKTDGASLFYEDVGRHNALDKIIGRALISGLDIEDGVLLTSGRISSEILLKTAGLGIPVLISTSAPTNLAVKFAVKINMTLIGFARGARFNIYSGESRVI